ncbi:uncharacterized protein J7T54_007665 [Emericellopsis cladophorae]|uniref:Uncharacterized protein n=1 Tax=Emericellopsis cladophorae TaxID=2686198 RepID=A0A9Q0B9Y0_9HYPO|nr:uncharacterized protein J7T54_007665 [Emericellopsis cladophorae]KAI6778057.1 hypothetical protein J7T54_007665 [Emericellopsis cladophorae]
MQCPAPPLHRLCAVADASTTLTAEAVADIVRLGGLVKLYIQLCSSKVVADMRMHNIFLGNNPETRKTPRREQCPARRLEYEPLYWCVISVFRAPHEGYKVDYTFLFTIFTGPTHNMAGAHELAISLERMRPYVAYDFASAHLSKLWQFGYGENYRGRFQDDDKRGPGKCPCCDETTSRRYRLGATHADFLEPFELLTLPQRSNPSAWLEYHENSHELLGALWTDLREHFFDNDVLFLRGVVADDVFDFLDHHAQAEHVKLLRLERAALEMKIKTEMVFNLALDTDHESEEDEKLHAVDHVEVATIKTTRRAYGLIRHLYPTTAEESGRTYPRDKFVAAMGDLCFAVTNCGGSAVALFPVEPLGGKPVGMRINLHRPHEPNINLTDMSMFAERMGKKFGWTRGLFEA